MWLSKQERNGWLLVLFEMKYFNRNILVLLKQDLKSKQAIEKEMAMLNDMLYHVEKVDNLAVAFEIIDCNNYKIVSRHHVVKQYIRSHKEDAFVFMFNRN
ncbi:MAG: hypothetical protein KF829_07000 [Ferruginibacter sp.]|nr:hypothetical protein [Ferruginibacter sp.]